MAKPTKMLLFCCVLAIQTYQRSNNGDHHQQSSPQNQYHPKRTTSPRHWMSQSFQRPSDTWCSTLPTRHRQWQIQLPPKRRQETPSTHAQSPPKQRKHSSRFLFHSPTEDGKHPPHHMLHWQTMQLHPRCIPPNIPLPHGHKPKNNLICSIRSCNLRWHVNSWFKKHPRSRCWEVINQPPVQRQQCQSNHQRLPRCTPDPHRNILASPKPRQNLCTKTKEKRKGLMCWRN